MNYVTVIFTGFGAIGGIAGLVGLLNFFNTRQQVRDKGEADIAAVWNELTEGLLNRANNTINVLGLKEDALVDLVQEMIDDELDVIKRTKYQDRLDDIRRIKVPPIQGT